MLAISTDKEEVQAKFRRSLGAPYPFITDDGAALVKLFGVKMPLISLARRVTFVIGQDGRIMHLDSGKGAIDPTAALAACSIG